MKFVCADKCQGESKNKVEFNRIVPIYIDGKELVIASGDMFRIFKFVPDKGKEEL